jgi:hypothetical protein
LFGQRTIARLPLPKATDPAQRKTVSLFSLFSMFSNGCASVKMADMGKESQLRRQKVSDERSDLNGLG